MELIEIYGFRHSSVICGPLQFLSLIYHAECVFSSSFHGVAFSIIFNTPFYTHLRFNQGRVISILEAFGLKKRFINSVNEITVNEQPDWQDVNQKSQCGEIRLCLFYYQAWNIIIKTSVKDELFMHLFGMY
ncbi:MAG: polysaccharide pyruvyl transferase family protein [Parabacteroides distasonis]